VTDGQSPALEASQCAECGNVAFPRARGCQRCGAEAMHAIVLGRRGTVWGYTVQRFPPKSPPYVPPSNGFRPFAVGYVELPEGVKVQAVLDCEDFTDLDDDAVVELVATAPVPRFAAVVTSEEDR
jgi:uncharacterized OB-fold protein